MAAILDKYAIKEVADVMFYELDSKGAPSAPVIYFDTLKVSTISQSSEKVDARGGKSNVKLLTWDTNKEITLELEDAVFSAKSLGIMFGGDMRIGKDDGENADKVEVLKTLEAKYVHKTDTEGVLRVEIGRKDLYIDDDKVTTFSYQNEAREDVPNPVAIESYNWNWAGTTPPPVQQELVFVTFNLLDCRTTIGESGEDVPVTGIEINIGAEFDSNTYYITGDTYARNLNSGVDEFLQFIIPKGKVSAEDVSITMEADGDPATFTMNVDCLKSADGSMLKFVKYMLDAGEGENAGLNKGVASVLYEYEDNHADWDDPHSIITRD